MFAALHLPAFSAVAALRTAPELRAYPCAIVADPRGTGQAKAVILAVNPAAAAWKITPGWNLGRARARCAELRVLPRDPGRESLLANELLVLAESLSPDFEQTRPDTLLIDLSGNPAAALPPHPRLPGLRFCRAATPELCLLAILAETTDPPGKFWELASFDPLPLGLSLQAQLPGAADFCPLLESWGIRSLGEFRRLPARDLAERLGPHATHLHHILAGRSRHLLRLHRPLPTFIQGTTLESGIHTWEPLLFELKRLLDTLCVRLQASHFAAAEARLRLSFEKTDPITRCIRLPEPLASPAALIRPLQALIETLQLPAAVVAVELELQPVKPLAAQRAWFGPQLRQPQRWADTLLRLEALLGPGNIGLASLEDSHRPDSFQVQPAPTDPGEALKTLPPAPSCTAPTPIPLRRFRPPLRVSVASESDRSSATGSHRPRPLALLSGSYSGTVSDCRGPFPISGNWWKPDAWQQVEWDVQLHRGHLLRLAFRPPGDWRIEGLYP